ncbi:Hypothetical protein, putative, partial [Bodo saltans]
MLASMPPDHRGTVNEYLTSLHAQYCDSAIQVSKLTSPDLIELGIALGHRSLLLQAASTVVALQQHEKQSQNPLAGPPVSAPMSVESSSHHFAEGAEPEPSHKMMLAPFVDDPDAPPGLMIISQLPIPPLSLALHAFDNSIAHAAATPKPVSSPTDSAVVPQLTVSVPATRVVKSLRTNSQLSTMNQSSSSPAEQQFVPVIALDTDAAAISPKAQSANSQAPRNASTANARLAANRHARNGRSTGRADLLARSSVNHQRRPQSFADYQAHAYSLSAHQISPPEGEPLPLKTQGSLSNLRQSSLKKSDDVEWISLCGKRPTLGEFLAEMERIRAAQGFPADFEHQVPGRKLGSRPKIGFQGNNQSPGHKYVSRPKIRSRPDIVAGQESVSGQKPRVQAKNHVHGQNTRFQATNTVPGQNQVSGPKTRFQSKHQVPGRKSGSRPKIRVQ